MYVFKRGDWTLVVYPEGGVSVLRFVPGPELVVADDDEDSPFTDAEIELCQSVKCRKSTV